MNLVHDEIRADSRVFALCPRLSDQVSNGEHSRSDATMRTYLFVS